MSLFATAYASSVKNRDSTTEKEQETARLAAQAAVAQAEVAKLQAENERMRLQQTERQQEVLFDIVRQFLNQNPHQN